MLIMLIMLVLVVVLILLVVLLVMVMVVLVLLGRILTARGGWSPESTSGHTEAISRVSTLSMAPSCGPFLCR